MNLAELKSRLCLDLNETLASPQFWSLDELVDNINEGYREVIRRTGFGRMNVPLVEAGLGSFYVPHDIMTMKRMYWKGKPIDQKSVDALEAEYAGTAHDSGIIGSGKVFSQDFRTIEGDPVCWYFEDGKIKLFPRPVSESASSTLRETVYGTASYDPDYSTNNRILISLPSDIPLDQGRSSLWFDGVFQFPNQWTIVNPRLIHLSGPAVIGGSSFCVRYFPSSVAASTVSATKSFQVFLSAGSTRVPVPGGYTQGIGALAVNIDGMEQDPSTYAESAPGYITLASALVQDTMIEIEVTYPDPTGSLSMLYSARPQELSNDTDEPTIPTDLHRAIWQYASFLSLTRDGRAQDLKKAELKMSLFENTLSKFDNLTKPAITLNPRVGLAFRL